MASAVVHSPVQLLRLVLYTMNKKHFSTRNHSLELRNSESCLSISTISQIPSRLTKPYKNMQNDFFFQSSAMPTREINYPYFFLIFFIRFFLHTFDSSASDQAFKGRSTLKNQPIFFLQSFAMLACVSYTRQKHNRCEHSPEHIQLRLKSCLQTTFCGIQKYSVKTTLITAPTVRGYNLSPNGGQLFVVFCQSIRKLRKSVVQYTSHLSFWQHKTVILAHPSCKIYCSIFIQTTSKIECSLFLVFYQLWEVEARFT